MTPPQSTGPTANRKVLASSAPMAGVLCVIGSLDRVMTCNNIKLHKIAIHVYIYIYIKCLTMEHESKELEVNAG